MAKALKVVGIDEVGRGCWAGPLVAAAVLLKYPVEGLKDSKLLSKKQREYFSSLIYDNADVGLSWVSAKVIDQIGLTKAVSKAMAEALSQIESDYDQVIVDGHFNFLAHNPLVTTMVKADLLVPAVSAASIVAKVARDNYMREIAEQYPHYQFEKHVGYGTQLHHELLKLYGACDLHRMSYKPLQALLSDNIAV